MLRTLIVDDEPVARNLLAEELAEIDDAEVIGEAENGVEAVRRIEDLRPDLVLLDIQMPVKDGFEVVRSVGGPLPAIIFVTAYSEHALRAFEVGAVDYLLKPVSQERLKIAVERVRESRRSPLESAERVAKTLNAETAFHSQRRPKIVARRGHDYHLLDLDDKLAGSQFQRVHRGALVNTDKIRKMGVLSSQRWLLTLTNGLEFTVSKRQAPLMREWLR